MLEYILAGVVVLIIINIIFGKELPPLSQNEIDEKKRREALFSEDPLLENNDENSHNSQIVLLNKKKVLVELLEKKKSMIEDEISLKQNQIDVQDLLIQEFKIENELDLMVELNQKEKELICILNKKKALLIGELANKKQLLHVNEEVSQKTLSHKKLEVTKLMESYDSIKLKKSSELLRFEEAKKTASPEELILLKKEVSHIVAEHNRNLREIAEKSKNLIDEIKAESSSSVLANVSPAEDTTIEIISHELL